MQHHALVFIIVSVLSLKQAVIKKRNTYMTCGDNKHCSKSKALRKIQNKS